MLDYVLAMSSSPTPENINPDLFKRNPYGRAVKQAHLVDFPDIFVDDPYVKRLEAPANQVLSTPGTLDDGRYDVNQSYAFRRELRDRLQGTDGPQTTVKDTTPEIDKHIESGYKKMERLATEYEVALFVGKSILRNTSYLKVDYLLVPISPPEKRMARRLDKIDKARRNEHALQNHLAASFPQINPRSDIYNIMPVNLTRSEKKNIQSNAKLFNKSSGKSAKLDKKFESIINQPKKRAENLADKLAKLTIQKETLSNTTTHKSKS
jgi:hypothetical protein